jgi:hypothetical protein
MNNATFNALLHRGFDSDTANQLSNQNYTITSLQQLSRKSLKELGISDEMVATIKSKIRPAIPSSIIIKLLYESKRTCCICRDSSKSVVIHHLEDWSKTRDHSEENLVVLCLHHHGEAHTKRHLSSSLTKTQIQGFKKKWINDVLTQDAKALLGLMNFEFARWDYFNVQRLFELFLFSEMDGRLIGSFERLRELNVIDKLGIITSTNNWKIEPKPSFHLCDFGEGSYLTHYLSTIANSLILNFPVIDFTGNLNRTFFKSTIKSGSVIVGQAAFYFADIDKFDTSKPTPYQQRRKCYYKGHSIIIEFSFNAEWCTSTSARTDALVGHQIINPVLFVRSITENESRELVISCSCLAIGTNFDVHPLRN